MHTQTRTSRKGLKRRNTEEDADYALAIALDLAEKQQAAAPVATKAQRNDPVSALHSSTEANAALRDHQFFDINNSGPAGPVPSIGEPNAALRNHHFFDISNSTPSRPAPATQEPSAALRNHQFFDVGNAIPAEAAPWTGQQNAPQYNHQFFDISNPQPGVPAPWIDQDDHFERTVSQRLGSVKYSRHLPRVNSQPLSPEDSSTARARLLSRLDMYGLCEVSVHGDGNCQFRAVSDQLYRTPDEHGYIRAAAVAQLRAHPDLYHEYIPEDYEAYCYNMQHFGTWGDHVTLQALADAFGVKIAIMTSYQDSCVVEIQPQGQLQSQRVLYLSFWAEVHYNSVYPEGEMPRYSAHNAKRKLFGSKKLGRMVHAFAG